MTMKNIAILAALATLFVAGCGPKEEATTDVTTNDGATKPTVVVAYDLGTKKKGDQGVCVMCNAKEGTTAEEPVAETIDYEGKTYLFCNEAEKAEFISDPAKYAKK